MSVLIRGVRRYGEGEPVDVLVDGGRSPTSAPDLASPADAEVIDATGQILLPGFRRPAHPLARTRPRVRRGHRNRFGGSRSRRVHRGVRDGQHQPGRRRPGGHRSRVAPRPAGRARRRAPGRRGHRRAGGQAAHRDGHDGRGVGRVRMFSDDGICVYDPLIMRRALEYATGLGVLIAQHAEEPRLTVGAVAHEGPNAARLGLAGWPRAAEESIVARDALLARDAGARVHICHASTAGTVEISDGPRPGHLDHRRGDAAPPAARRHPAGDLRRPEQGQSAAAGGQRRRRAAPALADGVIDCVATDHAPHAEQDKSASSRPPGPACSGCRPRCRSSRRRWSARAC